MSNQRTCNEDVIELGELDEDLAPIKWRNYEVHHLIAIRGKMNNEFAKTTNKQVKTFKTCLNIFYKI